MAGKSQDDKTTGRNELENLPVFPTSTNTTAPRDRAYSALEVAEKRVRQGAYTKGAQQALDIAKAWLNLAEFDRRVAAVKEEK